MNLAGKKVYKMVMFYISYSDMSVKHNCFVCEVHRIVLPFSINTWIRYKMSFCPFMHLIMFTGNKSKNESMNININDTWNKLTPIRVN